MFAAGIIDPPWDFQVWAEDTGHGRSAESHYSTMSVEQMCALPIGKLFLPDAVLLMWVTWPHLFDAKPMGEAWGFEYKTLGFDWLKRTSTGREWFVGMGHWTRANSEGCLLFTRGHPKRQSRAVRQLIAEVGQLALFPPIVANVTEHSAKPLDQYERLERLVDGPYVEIFARIRYPGWTCIGYDVDGLDITESIPKVLSGEIAANVR